MTREEALGVDAGRYDDNQPCRYGHAPVRYASNKACCECSRLQGVAKVERRRAKRAAAAPVVVQVFLPEPIWTAHKPKTDPWVSCIKPVTREMMMGRRAP